MEQQQRNTTTTDNVGIGTTTPGYKLEVNGSTKVDTLSINPSFGVLTYAGGVFSAFDILAHSGKALSFGSNDVYDRMLLDTNGNVGSARRLRATSSTLTAQSIQAAPSPQ